ncbi:MAG: GNAT family N-acetyltransferase [Pseudomonadota bacterium]
MTIVDERGPLQIRRSQTLEAAFADLLSRTRFGTHKLTYRRRRVSESLTRLSNTHYFSLYDGDHLVGGYALTPTDIIRDTATHKALYRHALFVDDRYQQRGLGHWLVNAALDAATDNIEFSFGSIELGNRRSSAVVDKGSACTIGHLRSELIYRQWTRRSALVAFNPEEALIRAAVDDSESDCTYRFASRRDAPYYGVLLDGQLAAGASARLNSLDLRSPGPGIGRAYASLVRFLPAARRRFDPADFRFVSLSDVVVAANSGNAWNALVSHILYEFGAHMAGVTLDPRRIAYQRLCDLGLLGRFARATREEFKLVARPHSSAAPSLDSAISGLAPLDM